jgi:hypothetical protein
MTIAGCAGFAVLRWLPEQKAAGTWRQKAQELFQVCSVEFKNLVMWVDMNHCR